MPIPTPGQGYTFDGGLVEVRPIGPRPAQFGASDPVRTLSARIDALLATMPKSAPTKATAPAHDIGDELDGAAIFAARQRDIEAARTTTTKPQAATDEIDAAAIFAKRGQHNV